MRGNLYIVAGCSGVGKGTILKKFLERNENVKFSISATTRKPRVNEVDGVNYFYISQEEFKSEIENNAFLEWTEFSGNFYGTKKAFVEKTLDKELNFNLETLQKENEFDATAMGSVPYALFCFLEAGSFEDAIRKALSIGGDTDTIACIAGSVAGAFYGVPENLARKAQNYIPDFYQDIINNFTDQFIINKDLYNF